MLRSPAAGWSDPVKRGVEAMLISLSYHRERNTVQRGEGWEKKPPYLCGVCKSVQTPALHELPLVMSRKAVLIRPSARFFSA